jgi:hypothetical protein
MNAPIARRPNGTLLPGGAALNPGGRPRSDIEELRAQYRHRLPELVNGLFSLTKSDNESIRLAAYRELLDRLLGKPVAVVESTHTRVDIGQLYLSALQRANQPTHGTTIEGAAGAEKPKQSGD